MDVVFEIPGTSSTYGYRFTYFDMVREIMEKVQRHWGIPVATQRLFFRSQELADELDTGCYSILRGSHVLLLVRRPPAPAPALGLLLPAKRVRTTPDLVHGTATFPFWHSREVSVIALRDGTVAALKRRIHRAAQVDAHELERMAAVFGDVEMQDDPPLLLYVEPASGVMEVKIMLKEADVGSSRTVAVELHAEDADAGVLAEVRLSHAVTELRQQLSLLAERPELPLVARGNCHFELDGEAMDEGRSLRENGFEAGVIIHVVSGRRRW